MSYTIEINGIKVEGDSLKEATRLAKKEEKRQAVAEEERKGREEKAYQRAYAEIGQFACHQTKNLWFWKKYSGIKQDGYYTVLLVEQETTGEFRTTHQLSTVLAHASGKIYGARVFDAHYSDICWFALGVYEGECAAVFFPPFLAELLEKAYQEELSKSQQQEADKDRIAS